MADDDGIDTGDTTDPQDGTEPSGDTKAPYGKDVESMVRRYGGNPRAAMRVLMDEAKKNRDKINRLAGGDKDVKLEPDLPDGAVVLTGAEASTWESFKALGKTPRQLSVALKKAGEDEAELSTLRAEKADRDADAVRDAAAEAEGWNAKLFRRVAKNERVHVEGKTVDDIDDVTGQPVKVVKYFARPADDADAELVPLGEYATKYLQDYPLDAGGTATQGANGQRTHGSSNGNHAKSNGAPSVVPYPPQSPDGTAARGLSDDELVARKRRSMPGRGLL